jgi:hypothetical protein
MRSRRLLLIALAVASSTALVANARAATQEITTAAVFAITVDNPCTAIVESIRVEWQPRGVFHTTTDSQGKLHVVDKAIDPHARGVDLDTGAEYSVAYREAESFNDSSTHEEATTHFLLHAKSADPTVPGFFLRSVAHLTETSSGQFSSFLHPDFGCF